MNENIQHAVGNASYGHFSKNLAEMIQIEAKREKMLEWDEEDLKESIESGDSILASVNKKVVGFVCLTKYTRNVEISALIVDPDHREKGIGKKLMEEAINLAKEKYSDKYIILFANNISSHMGQQCGFIDIDKKDLDNEFLELCKDCMSNKDFPDCHCQPMMLMQ